MVGMSYAVYLNTPAIKRYRDYKAIDQWIIRNLMTHGNCYMKNERYYSIKENYFDLFGVKNISITPADGDHCVVYITEEGKKKAYSRVFY